MAGLFSIIFAPSQHPTFSSTRRFAAPNDQPTTTDDDNNNDNSKPVVVDAVSFVLFHSRGAEDEEETAGFGRRSCGQGCLGC